MSFDLPVTWAGKNLPLGCAETRGTASQGWRPHPCTRNRCTWLWLMTLCQGDHPHQPEPQKQASGWPSLGEGHSCRCTSMLAALSHATTAFGARRLWGSITHGRFRLRDGNAGHSDACLHGSRKALPWGQSLVPFGDHWERALGLHPATSPVTQREGAAMLGCRFTPEMGCWGAGTALWGTNSFLNTKLYA